MLCPFCGKEMEKGLLQSGSMMAWIRKKRIISLHLKEGEVLLDKNYVTSCAIPAWICKPCKRIIAEYEEKTNNFE